MFLGRTTVGAIVSMLLVANTASAAAVVKTGKVKSVAIDAANGQVVFSIQEDTEETFFEVNNTDTRILQMIADTLNAAMSAGDDVRAESTDPAVGTGTEANPHDTAKVKRISSS